MNYLKVLFYIICLSLFACSKEVDKEKKDVKMDIKSNQYWKDKLSPEVYNITREKGTENPFSGKYNFNKKEGIYKCICCGVDLFSSDKKFDSGSGWPSFFQKINSSAIKEKTDTTLSMTRTEIKCSNCDAHLGHVFNDGPPTTGLRYCVNSASLNFVSYKVDEKKYKKAVFAAGCFWGVEDKFLKLSGVIETKVGYTGGDKVNPKYKEVCSSTTGHAEAVQIIFDSSLISYKQLLDLFFELHNPTTLNKQGPDIGTQYRSAIFYVDEKQKKAAENFKSSLQNAGKFDNPIITEITPLATFYDAEEYHQKYYKKRNINSCTTLPGL